MPARSVVNDVRDDLDRELEHHRAFLWGLAYRMTGVAADADDVVQDAFAAALAHPPSRDRPIRPWLVTVTMNRARDVLRKRKKHAYVGPWLPSPVDDDRLAPVWETNDATPERRALLKESTTLAFLVALERLTPMKRAVLVLRDVFDYSSEETAAALGISVANVKQTLIRARRALDHPLVPDIDGARAARTHEALEKFVAAVAAGDAAAVQALLAKDAEGHADGGGHFTAARVVLKGAAKCATVYTNLMRLGVPERVEVRSFNGRSAIVVYMPPKPNLAPFTIIAVDANDDGEITRVYSMMAPDKVAGIA